jgi:predicted ATP-grasp superfamily ATP-dependent carboligase
LELASNVIRAREGFDHQALHAALAGTVGEAAAASIAAFIAHQDSLPSWKEITENPTATRIPDQQGALAVLVYAAMERVTKDTLPAFLAYISRADEEWQCIFCIALARNKNKQAMAFGCKSFAEWVSKNEDLL